MRALVTIVACSLAWSCSKDPTDPPPNGADRKALLASIGEHAILRTYRAFVEEANELESATSALRIALEAGAADVSAERSAAQSAWRSAMSVWQEAELFQLGPAGASAKRVMGAQDLRDQIYSYPTVNSCRVDQEIVAKEYESPTFFQTALVNVYGLDAIEYLLFYGDADNTCPPQVAINQGPWDELGEVEVVKRRAAYAHAASVDLVRIAEKLRGAWEPTGENFLGQLANAGESGSIYGTAQEALDELFAAMFYLDLETKDMKLARPAGISPECQSETCPEALESPWSDHSKENVLANLRGFEKVFLGGPPEEAETRTGFDDLLGDIGTRDLASSMVKHVAAAKASVESMPGSMRDALVANPASVEAAHAAVKVLTDELKTRFVTVLNLRVPDEGAADND